MLKYHQFSTMHISHWSKSPTWVTCSTTTLIDHNLEGFSSRVSQNGVINVAMSDHQLIFRTIKSKWILFTSSSTCAHWKPIELMIIKEPLTIILSKLRNFGQRHCRLRRFLSKYYDVSWKKVSLTMLGKWKEIHESGLMVTF